MEHIYLLILSVIGFLVSHYIYYKKNRKEKLVCIIGKDCNKVINSKYSNLFKIAPNEVLGMLYYALVLVVSVLYFFNIPFLYLIQFAYISTIVSGLAALASLILISIQIFILKEYCEYCLVSAGVSILIFLVIIF
ncbi:MAG: vitamin K epoxide reductase family protein [Candidatus Woesearchaeota archaeon]|nr:MAG: vitamin K epoxide reductase family protein [Candidatus Woesearchaeota archaeon]